MKKNEIDYRVVSILLALVLIGTVFFLLFHLIYGLGIIFFSALAGLIKYWEKIYAIIATLIKNSSRAGREENTNQGPGSTLIKVEGDNKGTINVDQSKKTIKK